MKHLLSLLTVCLLSLSAQAQQEWNFVDLSESIRLIKADETNWKVDKYKTDAPNDPVQWSNNIAFTEWSTLKANGEEIPATKGLMFIGDKGKLIFSISSKKKNYFKLNSSKTKIKICNLKKGQKLTIVGLNGSKDEDRTFTAEENLEVISGMKSTSAEENLEVISGMKPTSAEHTGKAIVKADGDIVIGCTNPMNVYSISISAADDTGIAQTTISKPSGNDKFYTLDGKQVKPSHKGIIIAKGKKYTNK
jgi:ribosomal protein L24E